MKNKKQAEMKTGIGLITDVLPDFSAHREGLLAAFKASSNALPSKLALEDKDFRLDLAKAFKGRKQKNGKHENLGLLLKHLYYDTKAESWGALITTNKAPWDALITQNGSYSNIASEEERTINIALREGLMDRIPKKIHYVSLGPGESSAFKAKDCKIISSLIATSHEIAGGTIADIHDRYSRDAAASFYKKYNSDAYALKWDIFKNNVPNLNLPKDTTPLVTIFGGTLQNTPDLAKKGSDQEVVNFYSTLQKNLPGAHVVMTVDTMPEDINPQLAISSYEYSLEIELFALNFLARAKERKIIIDQNFDILKHWRLAEPVWENNSVYLFAEAKTNHTLETIDGTYHIKAGDRISISKSQKGPIKNHIQLLEKAGYSSIKAYPQSSLKQNEGAAKCIIHAAP
jgi:uncharacterized SAM-dependent methyltransferase